MSSPTPVDAATSSMKWESRADVIYHFHAYHVFDNGPRHSFSIDMINLDDADVAYYQQVADLSRGLDEHHKLAGYLNKKGPYVLPTSAASGLTSLDSSYCQRKIGYRQRLIHHVRLYNLTQEPRRRFYLLGLTETDMTFAKFLADPNAQMGVEDTETEAQLSMATDVCDAFPAPDEEVFTGMEVERAVKKFLATRKVPKPTATTTAYDSERPKPKEELTFRIMLDDDDEDTEVEREREIAVDDA